MGPKKSTPIISYFTVPKARNVWAVACNVCIYVDSFRELYNIIGGLSIWKDSRGGGRGEKKGGIEEKQREGIDIVRLPVS